MSQTHFPILQEKIKARSGEFPSAARELEKKLRASLKGEVRFDVGTRSMYSTDASNYRRLPIGLVLPRDAEDVESAIAACRDFGAPVLLRGGGTSLAGQCCNTAVVLDCSKYMRSIISLDPQSRTAVVEPGIILDRVREAAEAYSLTFAPDPATHNRCTIGGMIGNNSCGTHALMGGKTVDNVEALDVLLYDGTRMSVGAVSDLEFDAILARRGRKAEIFRQLRRIRDTYAEEIRRRFPKIPRRVSGYNLDELLPENGFNVARALVGSEGTLVTVLNATLKLVHSPQVRRLVALGFQNPFVAADAVPKILEFGPIGLEGFDGLLLEFMRRKGLALSSLALLPEGGSFLLVEFGGDDQEGADAQVSALLEGVRGLGTVVGARTFKDEAAAEIWFVRESALGASVFVPGEPLGWEGWEDAAVPPERLGTYLRQITRLMEKYGLRSPIYGHFGQGCVHLRINFDFESERGIRLFREFIDEAAELVLSLGGSISGEHGDGQARSALLPKMFGGAIMQAFQEFKAVWDPENKMNPGRIVDPIAVKQPTDDLRIATDRAAKQTTYFQFPDDNGSIEMATLRCVGVGACRKESAGVMCPSYMVTREEQNSTRGRAHLLWEMLRGELRDEGWRSETVKSALDLCLSCKACKQECPVNVDIGTYKAEFLAHYYEHRLRPLNAYAFGMLDRWASLVSAVPQIANLPGRLPIAKDILKGVLGIAKERTIPLLARRSFRRGLRDEIGRHRVEGVDASRPRDKVLLWPDTWNNYFHPDTAHSARQVLYEAGFEVVVPQKHLCCGRPLYDFGMLNQAKQYLREVLDALRVQIEEGIPVVVLEPSCASVFREEALSLLAADARYAELSKKLARQTYLLSELLALRAAGHPLRKREGQNLLLQAHCHQRPFVSQQLQVLRSTGANVELLDSGCCGMAGPFGFEKNKFQLSKALAGRVLIPALQSADEKTVVISDGFSCREQIFQLSGKRALHLAEFLASPAS